MSSKRSLFEKYPLPNVVSLFYGGVWHNVMPGSLKVFEFSEGVFYSYQTLVGYISAVNATQVTELVDSSIIDGMRYALALDSNEDGGQ